MRYFFIKIIFAVKLFTKCPELLIYLLPERVTAIFGLRKVSTKKQAPNSKQKPISNDQKEGTGGNG